MKSLFTLISLLLLVTHSGHSVAQHALDALLKDSSDQRKPRIKGKIDKDAMDNANAADDSLRDKARKVNEAQAVREQSTTNDKSNQRNASKSAGVVGFRCEFNCAKQNLTGATNRVDNLSTLISASTIETARSQAAKYAKSYCWDNHKMIPSQEWGSGSVRCTKE